MEEHTSTLRENHRKNIPKRRQCHKHRHDLLRARPKHVPKERGRDGLSRREELGLGDGGEVGDVAQDVEDPDRSDGQRRCDFQRAHGVFGFAEGLLLVSFYLFPWVEGGKKDSHSWHSNSR